MRDQGRGGGSHFKLIDANGGKPIVLAPHCLKDDIPKGTLSAILRQADLVRRKDGSIHEHSWVEKKQKSARGRTALHRRAKRRQELQSV